MKNSNYIIRNLARDLPTCSAVPQPTVPPRNPYIGGKYSLRETGYEYMNRVEFITQDCSVSKKDGQKAKAIGVLLKRVLRTTEIRLLL